MSARPRGRLPVLLRRPSMGLLVLIGLIPLVASAETEPCDAIAAGLARDRCLQKVAMESQDPSACESIADATWRVLLCLVPLAPSAETAARCEEMKLGDRVGCYSRIAYRLRDDSWCRRIINDAGRDYCVEQVSVRKDPSDPCNQFDDLGKRQECYTKRALEEDDPALCSRVGQSNVDDLCYRSALKPYLERAVREHDWSACDDPRIGRKRAECVVHLAQKLGSAEHCESIRAEPAGSLYVERCYQVAASANGDHGLCLRITEPLKRRLCIADTATTVQQCAESGELRGLCLQRVSVAQRDPGICRLIDDEQTRRDCYGKSRSDGYGSCEDVESVADRDDCHLERATWKGVPDLCQKIEDHVKRSVCRKLADLDALDADTCHALEERYVSGCILRLAVARHDPTVCAQLEDSELGEWCRGMAGAEVPIVPW